MDSVRPSWDAVWMGVADTIAQRSLCTRAKVGSVIVADDQSVLAVSYNGPPPGYAVSGVCTSWCPRAQGIGGTGPGYENCPSAHAEVNACARASGVRGRGATAYSTHSSCINCCKTMAASGIVRLVHRVGPDDVHRSPEISEDFLKSCGIEVVRWFD